jgi:DNA-binding LytR/AlgR family response regulator
MADELGLLLKKTLRDTEVARTLDGSPKLRHLIKRMYDEINRLGGEDADDGSVFPVKSGAETRLLRTCDIFFFESQGRKTAIRTKAQEISFYSNFEDVLAQLPEHFLRCHRSFIVNAKKARSVSFSENLIAMADGSSVPFSRSYRAEVREKLGNPGAQGGGSVQ